MVIKRVFKLLFVFLSVSLAGCGVWNSASGPFPTQAAPLPLTGDKASIVGASALLLDNQPGIIGNVLTPISISTGKPVPGFTPVELGVSMTYAISADREHLVFVTNSTMSCFNACLHAFNLRTWKEEITPIVLPNSLADNIRLSFDGSGKMVAVFIDSNAGNGGQLLLVDLAQVKIVKQISVSSNIFQMAFTSNGDLAVYGNKPGKPNQLTYMYVSLYSTPELNVKWQQDLVMIAYGTESQLQPLADPSQGKYLDPAAVFSTDQSRLYIVAADEPLLVTVDFTRQSVQSAIIQPRQSLLDRLMAIGAGVVYAKMLNGTSLSASLSMDGKYLYVVGVTSTAVKDQNGDWTVKTTPLGLKVVDTSNGNLVKQLDTDASSVAASLDGKTILLNGWGDSTSSDQVWTDLVDTNTYKITGRIYDDLMPSRLLDGSLAWLGTNWQNSGPSRMSIYRSGAQNSTSKLDSSDTSDSFWIPIP